MSKKNITEESLSKALRLRTEGKISTIEMMRFSRPIVALKLELESKRKPLQNPGAHK